MELFSEECTVWQALKETKKPIVLYGMGDGAIKILRVCNRMNIKISGIFASDEYVRGHSFEGYKVKKLSEIVQEYGDFVIVVAFAVHDAPMMQKLYDLSGVYELYAPDVPVVGEGLFDLDYVRDNADKLSEAYSLLADEQSKKVFCATLNFKISGKIEHLKACTTEKCEAYEYIIKPQKDESYVDLGAYDGDTIRELLSYTNGEFAEITAFEPDKKNYKKLLDKLPLTISMENSKKVNVYNLGAYSEKATLLFEGRAGRNSALTESGKAKCTIQTEVDSVDNLLNGGKATLIKFDVEGAERAALLGCANTLRQFAPKLIVSAYHRNEDIFDLPLLVKQLNPAYRLYLRHHPYIPAWDTNLYALPSR